jgi:predicted ribonuclease YlaK
MNCIDIDLTIGLVCGQNTQNKCKTHSKSREVKRIEEEVNDDKILNCCLDLSAFEDNVVLVTNDMNLCNKALMSGVNAINWNQLCHKYSINNDKRIDVEMDVNSSLKDQSIDDNNSESKHKRSKSDTNYRY